MKSGILHILILSTLSLLATLSSCHSSAEKGVKHGSQADRKKSPGKIVFEREIHNFGTLKEGEIVSFSFVFHNRGGSPFRLVKAEKSCGCIDLKYSTAEILPEESSAIELVLDTSAEWGNLIKGATIETSDGEKKELHIGAYIENKQFN